jgi:hypothetical protein
MDLETIQSMWAKDSVIDDVLLDEASLKIPQLHAKYLALHNEFSLLNKKANQELKSLTHKKTLYYSGKAAPEEYDEPFPYKVMKSDVLSWVAVDEQIQKVEMKLCYYDTVLNAVTEIIKQIHQMSYNIKNMIEWRRFTNGV